MTIYHRRRDQGLCPRCGESYRGIWIHCDDCRPVLAAMSAAARKACPLPAGLRHEGT